MKRVLFDPQTSGGLLLAIDPAFRAEIVDRLHDAGVHASAIGRVEAAKTADAARVLVRAE